MSKYCPIAKKHTNCTDNCTACLREEELATNPSNKEFYEDLLLEQREQM
jgi:hypothetical protein